MAKSAIANMKTQIHYHQLAERQSFYDMNVSRCLRCTTEDNPDTCKVLSLAHLPAGDTVLTDLGLFLLPCFVVSLPSYWAIPLSCALSPALPCFQVIL